MSLLFLLGDHLIPISPLHQQSRRDPQITFDLARSFSAALEQLQRFQLEFFRVGPVSWFLLVHHPSPVLPSLLDVDILCVYSFRATSTSASNGSGLCKLIPDIYPWLLSVTNLHKRGEG